MQTIAFEEYLNSPHPESDDGSFKVGQGSSALEFRLVLEKLPSLARRGPWLVGGTVRRLIAAEQFTTDWDFMFRNEEQFETFCGQMRERGADVKAESSHQITYDYMGREIQAIRAVYNNTLIQTLNGFDFTICQFGFDGTNLVWGDHSVDHLRQKKLVFTQTTDPIATMRRMFKYAAQGFFMDNQGIGKFLKSVQKEPDKLKVADTKWKNITKIDMSSFGEIPPHLKDEIQRRVDEMASKIVGGIPLDAFASGGYVGTSTKVPLPVDYDPQLKSKVHLVGENCSEFLVPKVNKDDLFRFMYGVNPRNK